MLLRLDAVSVDFGTKPRKRVVHDLSLEVGAGETVALVGESGSGKTTTGRAALCLQPVSGGRVLWGTHDIADLRSKQLRSLRSAYQMIPQDPTSSFDPLRTIGWSIESARACVSAGDAPSVTELIESVGLPASAADKFPNQFSGGQRQRLAIARSLATRPKLIVCDEITSALDVSSQSVVLTLLNRIQQQSGVALLFITHDLAVVRQIADRVAVMQNGRLVEMGTTDAVLDKPEHMYTKQLVAAARALDIRAG